MITTRHLNLAQRSWGCNALITCVLIAASAAATAGTSTSAASATDTHAVRVSYRDLNLGTEAGNRVLLQRITRAARQVCEISDTRDLTAFTQSQACERRAVSEAVEAVHSERLAALYARAQTRS